MSTPKPTTLPNPEMPPLVNGILTFFYVITILNITYITWQVTDTTPNGDHSYFLPVTLFFILFVVHAALNYIQYRREGGHVCEILWGFDEPAWRPISFMLIGYVLIFWINSINNNFWWLYTPWIAATFGMFRWKLALPIMAAGTAALFYQMGIIEVVQENNIPPEALFGISLGVTSTVAMVVMVTLLLRSQFKSAILVQELRHTKAQLEEALHKEKEVAVLRERNRMAREMHDGLGHALVLVAVKLEAAQRLQHVDPARAFEELESTKELVRTSMADLRASLADLRSPAFEADDKPLKEALRSWAERTAAEARFNIEFNFEPEADALPATIQDALWRVGREAVLNVVKHARASNVRISLFRKNGAAYLTVMDDGVGIPHLAQGSARLEVEGHYGIRGMRERVASLGGSLKFTPGRDGHGTLVVATVPLPPEPTPKSAIQNPQSKIHDRHHQTADS